MPTTSHSSYNYHVDLDPSKRRIKERQQARAKAKRGLGTSGKQKNTDRRLSSVGERSYKI
jgi:hypothetical protein